MACTLGLGHWWKRRPQIEDCHFQWACAMPLCLSQVRWAPCVLKGTEKSWIRSRIQKCALCPPSFLHWMLAYLSSCCVLILFGNFCRMSLNLSASLPLLLYGVRWLENSLSLLSSMDQEEQSFGSLFRTCLSLYFSLLFMSTCFLLCEWLPGQLQP